MTPVQIEYYVNSNKGSFYWLLGDKKDPARALGKNRAKVPRLDVH